MMVSRIPEPNWSEAEHNEIMRLHIVEGLTISAAKLRVAGCPVCGGDCAGANPPVVYCPMREATR